LEEAKPLIAKRKRNLEEKIEKAAQEIANIKMNITKVYLLFWSLLLV